MSGSFADQQVVITGGSTGIGLATAKALARQEARVIVASRSQEKLDRAKIDIGDNCKVHSLDVTDENAVEQFFETSHASQTGDQTMAIRKETKSHGMPWEDAYGYAQAVKTANTIYVSGQLSHDDQGNIVGPAPVDDDGNILDHSNMETQMRQSYRNAEKILHQYGAALKDVVEEVVYVTDMDAAFAVAGSVRKAAYGSDNPKVASTLLATPRLAFPSQLVEIKLIAQL